MTRRRAWICDFDGTISPTDIGATLLATFAPPEAAPMRKALFQRWVREEIGSRDLTRAECEPVRVDEASALEFVRGFAIDAAFPGFVRAARAAGDEVVIVSDGFDFYIHEHLRRAGLEGVAVRANVARFTEGRIVPEFPFAGGCGRCGNCKSIHVGEWRDRGFETVLVGDGFSDRCAAREADRIHAKRNLLAWCREQGMPVTEFTDFAALAQTLASAGGRSAASDSDRSATRIEDPDRSAPRAAGSR